MRKLGIILFVSFCLFSSLYLVVTALQVNSGEVRLKKEEEKLAFLKKENEELLKEIEYRKTDEFVINEARKTLNYGFEGEEIVVIPKATGEVETRIERREERDEMKEKDTRDLPAQTGERLETREESPKYLSNLTLWISVFSLR